VIRSFRSPAAYVQGDGALNTIAEHLSPDGDKAAILADATVLGLVGHEIQTGLEASDYSVETVEFAGACTEAEIERVTEIAEDADLVVGAGGGKALDTAKAVRVDVGGRLVTVPTIASTDAPVSSLSVLYTEDGAFDRFRFHDVHPDLVLVDTGVVARGPTRFFRSGIADALATYFEAETAVAVYAENVFETQSTRTAHTIAQEAYETIMDHGVNAVAAVERDAVTPGVEAVVEANTLMSGIGFESGGLAAAHAVHDGLTLLDAHGATHGEKVNIGTITQLVLEGVPTERIHQFIDLSIDLGLPVTLADIGMGDVTDEDLMRAAENACDPMETIHNEPFEVTSKMVKDALATADRLGRERTGGGHGG
jgi:glycerol dehydrogenase